MHSVKKVLFTVVFVFVAISARAQLHVGGQFSIQFSNEHSAFNTGYSTDKENAYLVKLAPKLYWNLNDKMQIGGRVGFAFGRLATGMSYSDKKAEEGETNFVNRAMGWSISPFFGYKLLDWKRVSIWGEANVFVGQYYNVNKGVISSDEWGRQTEYGFQILPVINIDIKESLALQIHLGFISLGWFGSTSEYSNKVVTVSTWDLHKGGFAGLVQGLADYGIGLVKKF